MSQTTGTQILLRTFAYLDAISEPVNFQGFIGLELTGDAEADKLLRTVSLQMLQQMISLGMVRADSHTQPGSMIYGLTFLGKETYQRLQRLANGA